MMSKTKIYFQLELGNQNHFVRTVCIPKRIFLEESKHISSDVEVILMQMLKVLLLIFEGNISKKTRLLNFVQSWSTSVNAGGSADRDRVLSGTEAFLN